MLLLCIRKLIGLVMNTFSKQCCNSDKEMRNELCNVFTIGCVFVQDYKKLCDVCLNHAISHFWNWALWMRGRFDQEPKGTMHTRAKQMGGCSAKDDFVVCLFFCFDNLRVCLLTNLNWFVMSQWCRSKSVQKSYLRSRIKIVCRVCNHHLGLSKGQSQWNLELYGC